MRIIVDLLGTGLEIYVALIFYATFGELKKPGKYLFLLGLLFVAALNVIATQSSQNAFLLPVIFLALMFFLSFYFASSITSKILLASIITAIFFAAEMLTVIFTVKLMGISVVAIQNSFAAYSLGILTSKLLALLLVHIIRLLTSRYKQESDQQFNLLMLFLPLQALILCFIVYALIPSFEQPRVANLSMLAVIFSICLVFIGMYLLNNQRKALVFKKEYEFSQRRLKAQIEHYQILYQAQQNLKAIRHDLGNNLLAISGMLSNGRAEDALKHIERIRMDIRKTASIVNTGIPPLDAVLNAKLGKAANSQAHVDYKVMIDDKLNLDPFDLAALVANALDNAIEGVQRTDGDDREISLSVSSVADYISILVKNPATGPIDEDFKTSKPDKDNHGFGIEQMKAIALKYDGDLQLAHDPTTGVFSLKVLLKN